MKGVQAATDEVIGVAQQVQGQVEAKTGKSYDKFQATEFATQVVAGLNYFIKVDTGANGFVFLRVFKGVCHAVRTCYTMAAYGWWWLMWLRFGGL
jgi:hypothetical protein